MWGVEHAQRVGSALTFIFGPKSNQKHIVGGAEGPVIMMVWHFGCDTCRGGDDAKDAEHSWNSEPDRCVQARNPSAMIIHTMTHERMVREARKDLSALRNACVVPLQKLRREQLLDPAADLIHMLPWTSPRKNNWLVVLRMRYGLLYTSSLAWFEDGKGRLSAVWTEHSGHAFIISPEVFQHYGDGACPDESAIERVQSFFLEHHTFHITVDAPQGDDRWSVHIGTGQGLGSGIWDARTDIVHWHTFADHGQVFHQLDHALERDQLLRDPSAGQRVQMTATAQEKDPAVGALSGVAFGIHPVNEGPLIRFPGGCTERRSSAPTTASAR
jgi:hypothetical protein